MHGLVQGVLSVSRMQNVDSGLSVLAVCLPL